MWVITLFQKLWKDSHNSEFAALQAIQKIINLTMYQIL